jgi:O-antigen/teichoic acid export membrane protein
MAYIFGGYIDFIGSAIGMAVSPHYTALIAKKDKKSDNDIYFITRWLQFGFIVGGFVIALWSKELMDLLISNGELKSGYPIAIIIIMSYTYRPYYWAAINKLQYYEKTAQLWKISFVAGLLNVVLNFIFLPLYGVKAAAITTFAAMLYMGFSGFFLRAYKEMDNMPYQPIPVMCSIILLTVLVYLIRDISPAMKLLISLAFVGLYLSYSFAKRKVFVSIEV